MHPARSTRPADPVKTALLIIVPVLFCIVASRASALDITVTGSWTDTVDQNDLRSGIGSNLNATYTSPTNVNIVAITNATGTSDAWQVSIRRIDTTWNPAMVLSVRRTSTGSGSGSIQGGTSYIQVTTSDQSFFTGAGNRSNVRVQLRLSGVSLQIPPNQYSTTVQYTIIDTP